MYVLLFMKCIQWELPPQSPVRVCVLPDKSVWNFETLKRFSKDRKILLVLM